MNVNRLVVPAALAAQLGRWARWAAPYEICGALLGLGERVVRAWPAANLDRDPRRFLMCPRDQLAIYEYAGRSGLELLAFYHSHPGGPAVPSARDRKLALHPEELMVIVWPRATATSLRAFSVRDGGAEVPLVVAGWCHRRRQGGVISKRSVRSRAPSRSAGISSAPSAASSCSSRGVSTGCLGTKSVQQSS